MRRPDRTLLLAALGLAVAAPLGAAEHGGAPAGRLGPGLTLPSMDPAEGRRLFAAKGCVVCHAVNGVGGEDAPPLDAASMPRPMNPFQFAANMWRGAAAMVYLQQEELGGQIELTGQELADITAFVHDAREQAAFSEADIPAEIAALMAHDEDEKTDEDTEAHGEAQD
jgi:cytochrome c